jgi:hypothetical protein
MSLKLRDIRRVVDRVGGVAVVHVGGTGPHLRVTLEYKGKQFMAIFPRSPSDHRYERNKVAEIRNNLKRMGVWDEQLDRQGRSASERQVERVHSATVSKPVAGTDTQLDSRADQPVRVD